MLPEDCLGRWDHHIIAIPPTSALQPIAMELHGFDRRIKPDANRRNRAMAQQAPRLTQSAARVDRTRWRRTLLKHGSNASGLSKGQHLKRRTGFGLSIDQDRGAAHGGGTLIVISTLGRGITGRLRFPEAFAPMLDASSVLQRCGNIVKALCYESIASPRQRTAQVRISGLRIVNLAG
jgi:hypothetical protein